MRRLRQPSMLAGLYLGVIFGCHDATSVDLPVQLQLTLLNEEQVGLDPTDLDFLWPQHMVRWRGDSLVIADGGNARLRIVAGDFQGGRAVGREGAGPGEFKRPNFVIASDGGFWVSDPGNGRIARVHADGTFGHTISLPARPITPDFAVVRDTIVIIPSPDPKWLLAKISGDSTTPFVARAHGDMERPPVSLASVSDSLLLALDNSTGLIYRIDLYTEGQDTFRLPAAVIRETAEREANFAKTAPRGMEAYFPLATSIAVDATRHRVLLLRPANYPTAGVLFDIGSGQMSQVLTRVDDLKLKPGLRSAILEGERITMLYDDRIRSYTVSRALQ